MSDELKEIKAMLETSDEEMFDEYLKPKRFTPRFWVWMTVLVSIVVLGFMYKIYVLDRIIPTDVLKSSLEIFDIDSQWVQKGEVHEKDYNGVELVPQISFRYRNIGKIPIENVNTIAVFRVLNRSRALGEDAALALKTPLAPGAVSDRVVLTSADGFMATSKKAFVKNFQDWNISTADIYVKSGGPKIEFLKQLFILKRVEGEAVDMIIRMN